MTFGLAAPRPTASTSPCWPWACSASPRSCAISRTPRRATSCDRHDRPAAAELRGLQAVDRARSLRGTAIGAHPRHPARQRRGARPLRVLHGREEARQGSVAASARAPSRASPGRKSANNAGAQTAFIPLLTLGIPPNAVMALMVGAMTIHGIIPGPQVMTKNPNLFWGMIASMWIGNLMLLDHQPAAGRPLGEAAEGALPPDVPGDPDVLLHRHLLDQQRRRRTCCSRLLRPRRLRS